MATKQQFIAQMTPYAIEASRRTGVDPNVILAQAALESNWGKSAPGNNYFGIKGNGQTLATKEVVNGKTVSTKASFRTYDNPLQSFLDWATLISTNPRYAGVVSGLTPAQQIAALGASGYATDPKYATKLGNIIGQIAPMDIRPSVAGGQRRTYGATPQPAAQTIAAGSPVRTTPGGVPYMINGPLTTYSMGGRTFTFVRDMGQGGPTRYVQAPWVMGGPTIAAGGRAAPARVSGGSRVPVSQTQLSGVASPSPGRPASVASPSLPTLPEGPFQLGSLLTAYMSGDTQRIEAANAATQAAYTKATGPEKFVAAMGLNKWAEEIARTSPEAYWFAKDNRNLIAQRNAQLAAVLDRVRNPPPRPPTAGSSVANLYARPYNVPFSSRGYIPPIPTPRPGVSTSETGYSSYYSSYPTVAAYPTQTNPSFPATSTPYTQTTIAAGAPSTTEQRIEQLISYPTNTNPSWP